MSQPSDSDLTLSDGERASLGAFRSVHPAASGIHKVNLAIASVFTLLPGGGAIAFAVGALNNPGKGMWIGVLIFGALALGPAIGVVYLALKLRWRLYLFENGFVFARGSNRVILWEDVQSFYEQQDVVAGIRADRWLRFLFNDGRRLTVDSSYRDFAAFAEAARNGVTQAVLRRAERDLPAGRSIAFGKLKLSQAGLEKEGDSIPWADVEGITIEPRIDGQVHAQAVVIYKRGMQSKGLKEKVEWYMKMVPRFGNVDAFLHLASQFTRIVGPEAQR
jgi:hypothetical protein